jgi:hypothetical protein
VTRLWCPGCAVLRRRAEQAEFERKRERHGYERKLKEAEEHIAKLRAEVRAVKENEHEQRRSA